MNRQKIIDFLTSHKQEMYEKYGVIQIGLFGSYARGNAKEDSDIDIAVEIESKNKFRSFFELKRYLEINFDKRVDMGIESNLKPRAKKYILKEIIYA